VSFINIKAHIKFHNNKSPSIKEGNMARVRTQAAGDTARILAALEAVNNIGSTGPSRVRN